MFFRKQLERWPQSMIQKKGSISSKRSRPATEAKLGPNIGRPSSRSSSGCGTNLTATRFLYRLLHIGTNGRNGYGGGKAAKRSSWHRQNTGSADEKAPRMSSDPRSYASAQVNDSLYGRS